MIKTGTLLAMGILLTCAIFIPAQVYAWDDYDESEDIRLIFPCDSSWCSGIYQGSRWPDSVAGRAITKFDAPPQLDAGQAFRWTQAWPSAKPRLAMLYGVPPEIAELYGAKYTTPQ